MESWFVKEKKVDGEKQGKGKKSGSGLEGWDERYVERFQLRCHLRRIEVQRR